MKKFDVELKQALRLIKSHCVSNFSSNQNCKECQLYQFCKTEPATWSIDTVDFAIGCPHSDECVNVFMHEMEKASLSRTIKAHETTITSLRQQRDSLENILNEHYPDWKSKISKKGA